MASPGYYGKKKQVLFSSSLPNYHCYIVKEQHSCVAIIGYCDVEKPLYYYKIIYAGVILTK